MSSKPNNTCFGAATFAAFLASICLTVKNALKEVPSERIYPVA